MDTPRLQKPFTDQFRRAVGDGFIVGSVLGGVTSIFRFPRGGIIQGVCKNVPRLGAYGAVYSGARTAVKYAMVSARPEDEPMLNDAVAAAAAGGIIALPHGVRTAALCAFVCGASSYVGTYAEGLARIGLEKMRAERKLSRPRQADAM